MHVKPILAIRDGEVVPVKRVRGNQKAMQEFVDAFSRRRATSRGCASASRTPTRRSAAPSS